jgi:two-component system response regulator FixJ
MTSDQPIYLIDDDEIVRDSLKVLIESYGMPVAAFRSTTDFLSSSDPAAGGCLVLGFNRFIMDGLDLVRSLRRRGSALPVIFIVGGGNAITKAAVLALDGTAYLERPVEECSLLRAIELALGRRVSERSQASAGTAWNPCVA